MTTTFGVQGRFDDVFIDRRDTIEGPATVYDGGLSVCSAGNVRLDDEALPVANNTRLAPWLRTDIGAPREFHQASDRNLAPRLDGASFRGSKALTVSQRKGATRPGGDLPTRSR